MSTREEGTSTGPGDDSAPDLGLGGALPCAVCRYNLQGISILGVCPECGTAVRATILTVVDPLAEELRPLPGSKVAAAGLLIWSVAAFGAALAIWRIAADRFAPLLGQSAVAPSEMWFWTAAVFLMVSGAGALAYVASVRTASRAALVMGIAGVLMYLPAVGAAWRVHALSRSAPVLDDALASFWQPAPERALWRVGFCGCLVLVLVLLRPAARVLVTRSLVIRTGRVDRQTIAAMASALGLVAVGDLVGVFAHRSTQQELAQQAAAVIMAAGGLLLTLGLAGAMADSYRIARALVAPSPGVRQVLHGDAKAAGGGRGGRS